MDLDPWKALAGFIVGFTVGLTGMGGGALMTPILVLIFGVDPGTAVSSDLLASLIMKPVGATVHLRRGTVNWSLARWLAVGSVPAAFAGMFVLNELGSGPDVANQIKTLLGWALIVAAVSMVARALLTARAMARVRKGVIADPEDGQPVQLKRTANVCIGLAGGFIVGMTSVGSGSLMMVMLLLLYPRMSASSSSAPIWSRRSRSSPRPRSVTCSSGTSTSPSRIPAHRQPARRLPRREGLVRTPDAVIRPALRGDPPPSALKLLDLSNSALGVTLALVVLIGAPLWGATMPHSGR